ncbi:flagellar basal body rod protein FlgB [Segnochrobactrum spirostomi]|uniref:Flagellar basal body rod protein FlgB n=1 Tax=Segnochrobactrum spirostomi TaxID=2608987 RepID=A0A6A7Y213_9HYPH|nr:flagellar basal body rod protein FlgB [Segnochrobactrum spirostomi]MQT12755.1 flagellar basal body rod protein FlgB [Segnochrobactrum spirostomi]
MERLYLLDLAARNADWASVRQTTIASNIANANTPGYLAREVEPFSEVLDQTRLAMAKTSSSHLDPSDAALRVDSVKQADDWSVSVSGNSVSLDQELIKAGEVNRAFSLDTSIMRSFQRMLLASVRSGS